MILSNIKKLIVKGINDDTGLLVVDTDNNYRKPNYPYYSLKFLTARQNDGEMGNYDIEFVESLNPDFTYDVLESLEYQPKVIISFNCFGDDITEVQDYIYKAWEWFRFIGRFQLKRENYVVVDVGNITDRTVLLVDNYEYRQGFDVVVRVLHRIENRIENIEDYKIKGEIV